MNFRRLGIGNTVFLALNLVGVIVGVILLIVLGPTVPLVLLIVGAIGLALKKLVLLFGWEDEAPTKKDVA
jgi:hypothetical protein